MGARGKPKAPENETNADRFKRVATTRVNNALVAVSSIGGLNTASYEYTKDQVSAIETALTAELAKAIGRLNGTQEAEKTFAL